MNERIIKIYKAIYSDIECTKEYLKNYSPLYKDSHCPNEIVDVEVFVYFDDTH